MASLEAIVPFIPTCTRCGEEAVLKVLNEHEEPVAYGCNDHAQELLEEIQAEEDATHEGTIHDPVQDA